MSQSVRIFEVGPRDGLQNESKQLTVETRVELIRRLAESGLKEIEAGAFVSPKWVPQMADTEKVFANIFTLQAQGQIPKDVKWTALVPNVKGMEAAMATGRFDVAIFGAVTESFSKANINCTIDESFDRFTEVAALARHHNVRVRGYLSTVFGCPFEGKVSESTAIELTERMLALGVYEVSLGDTIGVANPDQVRSLLEKLLKKVGSEKISMHFHDTRGTGLANILTSLELGIRSFDSSLGGLGGCPYAPAASGNVATEDVIYMLHGMGYETGADLGKLIETSRWLGQEMQRALPSKVSLAGLPKTRPVPVR